MKKCSKVKNPCKICLQTVTKKNGIQCKGACKKWAHYKCLNYTPGKVQDIKAGIIIVTCPCPNCNVAAEIKEHLSDPPHTCNNQRCPANLAPKCEMPECPLNAGQQLPTSISPPKIPALKLESRGISPKSCTPACSQKASKCSGLLAQETKPPCMPESIPVPPCEKDSAGSKSPCVPGCNSAARAPSRDSSRMDLCTSIDKMPRLSPKSVSCSQFCSGVCNNAENKSTITQKSGDCKTTCSDSRLLSAFIKQNEKALLCTIQELCSAVGHLSQQIKDLMCRMINNIDSC